MNKFRKATALVSISALTLLAGCVGGGNNPYGFGASGGNGPTYGLGSAVGNTMGGGLEGAVLGAIIQSIAGSVLNGQIGSQLAPDDRNFRMQQLGGLLQSGAFHQAQQWSNPSTGNMIALNPVGSQSVDPNTRQVCRNLEEVVTLRDGRRIVENRRACQNPQTGNWTLVQ